MNAQDMRQLMITAGYSSQPLAIAREYFMAILRVFWYKVAFSFERIKAVFFVVIYEKDMKSLHVQNNVSASFPIYRKILLLSLVVLECRTPVVRSKGKRFLGVYTMSCLKVSVQYILKLKKPMSSRGHKYARKPHLRLPYANLQRVTSLTP